MSAPTADLRTAAFAAIAQATAENLAGSLSIHAAKIMRAETGQPLAVVCPAIKWALEHPQAEHLPVDSIVAAGASVAIKRVLVDAEDLHWQALRFGADRDEWLTDADVNRWIQDGAGTVLRVGGGS